ncbi:MAG: hypothetical protein EOO77_04130 [Oxalobacteraceae bacterium]|nr:MAG: hypothetical protein EOO77_04130 [Oxalobacteraceae bacterium]
MDDPTKGMTPAEALYHWATKRNPWLVNGRSGKFPYKYWLDQSMIKVNAVGNIIEMPPLVGVPCFGKPLPHLRFVHMWNFQKSSGKARPGRCRTCSFREACAQVVDARISSDPTLKQCADEYVKARRQLSNVAVRNGRAEANGRHRSEHQDRYAAAKAKERGANTRFRSELNCYVWISSNDRPLVAANWEIEKAKRASARKERMRQMRLGNVPDAYLRAIEEAAVYRAAILERYANDIDADRGIRRVPKDSLSRDTTVWKAVERRRLQGSNVTAYAIACDFGATGAEINKQRQWIAGALKRIRRYEAEIMAGCTCPLWGPFDPERWLSEPRVNPHPHTKRYPT